MRGITSITFADAREMVSGPYTSRIMASAAARGFHPLQHSEQRVPGVTLRTGYPPGG
jgi:hypothetical protein